MKAFSVLALPSTVKYFANIWKEAFGVLNFPSQR